MKSTFLKNALTLYLSTGIMAGMLCLISLSMSTYKRNLENWLAQLSSVTVKAVKMKTAVADIDRTIVRLRELYPAVDTQTSKEALLATADDLRRMLAGCRMTIGDMRSENGEQLLPITIVAENARYTELVRCIGYLQTRVMPYVSIQKFSIERPDQAAEGGRFNCTLDILVRMPEDAAAS